MSKIKNVMVIGGGGYVGVPLAGKILDAGYNLTIYDLFIFGKEPLAYVKDRKNLTLITGDVRDIPLLTKSMEGMDAIIHLACISNDPSVELDPALAKSINLDCFEPCVLAARQQKVQRFIYASSSSVYGVKEVENVTEEMELTPLTDYSRFKIECEKIVLKHADDDFTVLVLRPATVCGYSPRQRLDLTVNILTHHAVVNKKIRVFGGVQKRPNIHIDDITDLYVKTLQYGHEQIHKKIFNAGYENHSVMQIAEIVKSAFGENVAITVEPTDDLRSYHISSKKIQEELGFIPRYSIDDAVHDLKKAFVSGLFSDSMNNPLYYNIKRMKELQLK